ncbi:MAG: hypothetical protein GC168_16880 [Candidatus Hydrogenedens sp.]|nr:hypothetical protein [Candidatus Hydrogenedens sp.]
MNTRESKRGAALLYAIGLMAITGIIAAGVWQSMHRETQEMVRAEHRAAARYLAEGGLEFALQRLQHGAPLPIEEQPLGEGYFTASATPAGSGAYRIESSGYLRDGGRITWRVDLAAEAVFGADGALRSYTPLGERRP